MKPLHFENIPVWLWALLCGLVLLAYAAWQFERIRTSRFERTIKTYRAKNKANELIWNLRWKPRPRRLTHQPKDDKQA
jgi:hypothetical protein